MENESRVNVTEELNYLRSLIESIDGQVNTLVRGLEELRKAHLALTDSNIAASKETRVAIGAGIFMEATLKLGGKLLVPIGSDIFIHEDPAAVRTRLEGNMKEVETSISGLNSQRDEISRRYDTILAAAQSQMGAKKDVRRNQE
ncbi:prefoldin subunit alpha [Oxyplasma meridianum]|uniref:Prefoldin subunit alpha n=1 Tax=Oxyplasma meridianum TaxID=3073602 RepID=A0AAX4NHR3_9ARCH